MDGDGLHRVERDVGQRLGDAALDVGVERLARCRGRPSVAPPRSSGPRPGRSRTRGSSPSAGRTSRGRPRGSGRDRRCPASAARRAGSSPSRRPGRTSRSRSSGSSSRRRLPSTARRSPSPAGSTSRPWTSCTSSDEARLSAAGVGEARLVEQAARSGEVARERRKAVEARPVPGRKERLRRLDRVAEEPVGDRVAVQREGQGPAHVRVREHGIAEVESEVGVRRARADRRRRAAGSPARRGRRSGGRLLSERSSEPFRSSSARVVASGTTRITSRESFASPPTAPGKRAKTTRSSRARLDEPPRARADRERRPPAARVVPRGRMPRRSWSGKDAYGCLQAEDDVERRRASRSTR